MIIKNDIIKDSHAVKITVENDGDVIGRVKLYVLRNDLHQEPFGFMEDLYVDENHRKRGIGEKLIAAALGEARKNKCYKFIFTCSHPELYGWYERQGFFKRGVEFRMNLS